MEIWANRWLKPRTFQLTLLLTLISGVIPGLSAAPVITSVVNAASYKDPRLPGALISPGSIFIVRGSGLGPADIVVAPAAFQSTSLSGTSVKVAVNDKTVSALMYYTSATQVAALMPSNTPPGGGFGSNAQVTITVTYNGEDSAPTPFQGVGLQSAGLFTVDGSGSGPAIVTNPDYSLVSAVRAPNCGGPNTACGSANEGDTLTLWATGLGPVPGGDGAGSLGQSIQLPLTVWLGGVQAPVVYQGRSGCCIGLDQIVFTVPKNVPPGCAVPLVVQIATNVSNSAVVPVASGSRTCTPADSVVAAANIQQWASLASPTLGIAQVDQYPNQDRGFTERAKFTFVRASIPPALQPFLVSYLDQPPAGTCTVVPYHDIFAAGTSYPIETFLGKLNPVAIDAGSRFTFTGPKNTTATVSANSGDWVVISPSGTFIGSTPAGGYTFTGGPGNDVGAFTAPLTVSSAPSFTSPSGASNGLVVIRRQGMPVAWNPGGATGLVPLVLSVSTEKGDFTAAVCTVLASAGTFTIPAYALLALPSSGGFLTFRTGDVRPAASALFSASGLNLGIAQVTLISISQDSPRGFSLQ